MSAIRARLEVDPWEKAMPAVGKHIVEPGSEWQQVGARVAVELGGNILANSTAIVQIHKKVEPITALVKGCLVQLTADMEAYSKRAKEFESIIVKVKLGKNELEKFIEGLAAKNQIHPLTGPNRWFFAAMTGNDGATPADDGGGKATVPATKSDDATMHEAPAKVRAAPAPKIEPAGKKARKGAKG